MQMRMAAPPSTLTTYEIARLFLIAFTLHRDDHRVPALYELIKSARMQNPEKFSELPAVGFTHLAPMYMIRAEERRTEREEQWSAQRLEKFFGLPNRVNGTYVYPYSRDQAIQELSALQCAFGDACRDLYEEIAALL